ncbi:hypothetical protein HGM15179_009573, partial [Zosterops borbonicus]
MATPRRGEVDPSPPYPVQNPIWPEAIMKQRVFHKTRSEGETEIGEQVIVHMQLVAKITYCQSAIKGKV